MASPVQKLQEDPKPIAQPGPETEEDEDDYYDDYIDEENNLGGKVQNFLSQHPGQPSQIEWLLTSPTIPFTLRKEFFMLWEVVQTGNLNEEEIILSMFDFREWCIMYIMSIPEDEQGNRIDFKDNPRGHVLMRTDLNRLLNMMKILFRVQLSKSRDGFMVKELKTQYNKSESTEITGQREHKKKHGFIRRNV